MNTIEYYMKLPYRTEITADKDEGGYVASHPELKGCITCGKTVESAVAALTDAKQVWLEAALENGYEIPVPKSSTNDTYTIVSDEKVISVSDNILNKNHKTYENLSKS